MCTWIKYSYLPLLPGKGFDGIKSCRAPRRQEPEEHTYYRGTGESRHDGGHGKLHGEAGNKHLKDDADAVGKDNADHPANEADEHRLDQELLHDVVVTRPDRHPDADLVRALGHGYQHDVHDTNAADHQRDDRKWLKSSSPAWSWSY